MLSAAGVGPACAEDTPPVMALSGKFDVTPTGAAAYSMAISVPPGTGGITPALSLDYSSKSGDGIVGLGWMLSGLQSIEHCPRTVAQDGVHGSVNYDANDRFCIGGQRLVAVTGAYGADGTEYRTEIESFGRIVSHGTTGNGPTYFKVWTRSGQILELGNTTNSRLLAVGKTTARLWAVDSVSDAKGNYYGITYVNDAANGQIYPSRIDYTGNTSAGLVPYNSVQFAYNLARPDPSLSYQAGSLQQTTVLLTDIKTYTGTTLVSDYQLGYRLGSPTTHSRLTSASICDGAGSCLAPTTFGWQGGTGTLASTTVANGIAQGAFKQPGDFNGDGLTDFVAGPGCIFFGTSTGTFVASNMTISPNNNPGTSACFYGGQYSYTPYVTDLNGDGFSDLIGLQLYPINQFVSAYMGYSFLNNRSSVLVVSAASTTGAGPGNPFFTGDFNGDGRSDAFNWQLGLGNGDGTFTPASGPSVPNFGVPPVPADFDGDGCADVLSLATPPPTATQAIYYMCNPAVPSAALPNWSAYTVTYGDYNGDGKTDFLLSDATGSTLYLSTGTGISSAYSIAGLTKASTVSFKAGDFDGDGQTDIAVISLASTTIWLSTGTGFVQGPTITYNHTGDTTISASVGDWNSDGATDLWLIKNSGDTEILFSFTPELMTTVSNGIGMTTTVSYDRLNKNGSLYTKGAAATYPGRDVDGPLYVVSNVSVSNGIGGTYSSTYAYAGAMANLQGRGFGGFSSLTIADPQTGVTRTTNYRTDFPFIGLVASQSEAAPATGGGTVTVQTMTNTFADTNLGAGTDGVVRHFASLTKSVTAGADLDGTALPTSTTNYTYDAYGNVLTANTSLSDGSYKNVTNTYSNDTVNWFLGRDTSTTMASKVTGSVVTRTSCFTYDPATGLLSREVIEPVSTTNCVYSATGVQTDYLYDAFGHRTTTTVSGQGIATRSKTALYDSLGQFQTQGCNVLNQCETYAYDPRFGERTSLTTPNNLVMTWAYDTFGRMTLATRADGNKTAVTYVYCNGVNGGTASCATYGAVYQEATPENPAGAQNGPHAFAFYDALSRHIVDQVQGFSNGWIRTVTQYDANQRVSQTSRPYYTAGGTPAWTVNGYDVLGRVSSRNFPDGGSETLAYHGLTTSVTTDLGQTTTTVKNAQGLVASVTDALSNATSYVYDAYGNLKKVTDPAGNVISNTYDVRGNKTASTDPDLGHWTYVHNVLGELTSQTDAKHQVTTLTYDLTGRVASQTENNLVSTWTYGSTPANHNIGKPIEVKACTTAACTSVVTDRTFTYDSLARASANSLSIGGTSYTYTEGYNADGRPGSVAYPSGFTALYNYTALGYLSNIKDSATAKVYWKVTSRDAEMHALGLTFGNTVTQTNTYDPDTGLLTNERAGPSDSVAAFDYAYDTSGSLTYRSDNFSGVFEYACYDALHRLAHYAVGNAVTSCTSSGYKTVGYDAQGDITSKTGVGTYGYPLAGASRPHAVSSITGTVNGVLNPAYTYDANGNMITGAGRTVTSTAFNMAASIVQGTATVSFVYDGEHQRVTMTAPSGTTTYLNDSISGSMEEKLVSGSSTTWHDYIQADGHLVAEKFSGATSAVRYFVVDHLGSIAVVTDETGAVVERDAYDAWGKRRNLDGSDDTTCSLTSQTTRGYTGHEHVDSQCLINANARVYDPTIARFMSADGVVPDPYDQQSFNRYSYVRNRPLSATDPTGHDDDGLGGGSTDDIETVIVEGDRYEDYWEGFSDLMDVDIGDMYSGLTSYGTGAAGLSMDAAGAATAASGSSGGTKGQNDKNNQSRAWRLTTYHQNADGSLTLTVRYVLGTLNADNSIDVAQDFGGFSINVETTATLQDIADKKGGSYTLYLVAENSSGPSGSSGVGHVFIGGRTADGKLEAYGFYPQQGYPEDIFAPGQIRNNTDLLKLALSGDQDFAVRSFSVDQATYEKAMNYIQNYATWNNYDLFNNSCVTAALQTLNYAGVADTFYVPFEYPNEVYNALKGSI